jgi:pimeloyl-ACP methyl ester carboxylesterase
LPYAELDGLTLYYERAGSGDPELLFVHGWCCDHTAFGPQFDHFAQTHTVTASTCAGAAEVAARRLATVSLTSPMTSLGSALRLESRSRW